MKTGPRTQMEEQECGAAPHSCLIEMAHEVSTAGQVKQWLVLVLATAAAFEPEDYSPPGLRATAPDGTSSLVRRLRLLDPREPPVSQQENMVGLDVFSALAHQSKKVGRR